MEHTADFLKNVYRDLLSIRLFEEKQVEVYALGKVPGHIHSGIGEEAVAAGVVATRKQGDYFKFTHRPVGASVALGIPLDGVLGGALQFFLTTPSRSLCCSRC